MFDVFLDTIKGIRNRHPNLVLVNFAARALKRPSGYARTELAVRKTLCENTPLDEPEIILTLVASSVATLPKE